jgi:outer membrane protein OmpA-like peptidoglycan-associated protein
MSQGFDTMRSIAEAGRKLTAPLFAVALILGGCSSSDEDAGAEPGSAATPVESGSEEFPNLGTVPDQAPETTPKIDREALLQQLAADKANAEYTDEALTEETTQVSPAPPPPASTMAPEATATGEDGASADPAENPESAAAQLPPPEVAALPATTGDTAAVIFFQAGSDMMTDRDRAILHDVALLQRRQQVRRLTVVGHASKAEMAEGTGTALDMALARANAVAAQLMLEGVASSTIQTATAPVTTYDESGAQGAAANQRVEILLSN